MTPDRIGGAASAEGQDRGASPAISPEAMAAVQSRLLKGRGWRVGRQLTRERYTALVGGESWALELTTAEWQEFGHGLLYLQTAMDQIHPHLMEQETVTIEHKTDRLTLIASGFPQQYELYLQLHAGRGAEGFWPAIVVKDLVEAVQGLGYDEGRR